MSQRSSRRSKGLACPPGHGGELVVARANCDTSGDQKTDAKRVLSEGSTKRAEVPKQRCGMAASGAVPPSVAISKASPQILPCPAVAADFGEVVIGGRRSRQERGEGTAARRHSNSSMTRRRQKSRALARLVLRTASMRFRAKAFAETGERSTT